MATMNGAYIHDVVINEMADAFKTQIENVSLFPKVSQDYYLAAIKDDVILMANVIHKHRPDFDMNEFYRRAGYPGTYPQHRS